MKRMLGDEYPKWRGSYDLPQVSGLRINPMKISSEEFEGIVPFHVERIPWAGNGYFYPPDVRPAQHPYYHAGLYYLQEPSAMTPADRLPVSAGDRVLDLCAAPGGKSTQLAAKLWEADRTEKSGDSPAQPLSQSGVLVANEVSNARARALLRNLELFGARNFLVTNERPDRLSGVFPLYFDKILIDAPCSGEGMFRKQPEVAAAWSPAKVRELSKLQRQILEEGFRMLKPGGLLMYSTCTFSPAENEGNIAEFLIRHPEMEILEISPYSGFSPGRPDWAEEELVTSEKERGLEAEKLSGFREKIRTDIPKCVRIWPHRMRGEGHFLSLMKKRAEGCGPPVPSGEGPGFSSGVLAGAGKKKDKKKRREAVPAKEDLSSFRAFLKEMKIRLPAGSIEARGGRVYLMPAFPAAAMQLKFLRSGVYLGDLKKNRFEPSQPFALLLSAEDCGKCVIFPADDPRLSAFLRGESLRIPQETGGNRRLSVSPGWNLVLADRFPVGWGRFSADILKNRIPVSWRT